MSVNVKRSMYALTRAAAASVGIWAVSAVAVACVEGDMRGEAVTVEREVGTTSAGGEASINILGAGWLRAAEIVKQGGSSGNTSVTLEVDGQPLISTSFAALQNAWMQLDTPFIVAKVRTQGNTSTMTIWYQPEPRFLALAALRVEVQEDGVESLRLRTTMNKPYPHTHLPGQQPAALALPAFK